MERRVVLVTGATGNQGGAAVDHLLERKRVAVRAMTRDPATPKARKLSERGVEVVAGDFGDRASLDRALAGVSAVFVMSTRDGAGETEQGVAMANAAKAAGTEHFVYTSVDGAERSSGVPHFETKWAIERHIGELGLPATVLRPVMFADNFAGGRLFRSLFLGMLRAELGDRPVQMVAVSDIGWFAAEALESPERWIGRTLGLAGDDLTVPQIAEVYRKVEGARPWVVPVPRALVRRMPEDMAKMLRWFGEHGYTVDVAAVRREHPALLSFEGWLSRRP